jgi:hypothetical protein
MSTFDRRRLLQAKIYLSPETPIPSCFAAVVSTSFTTSPDAAATVIIDGVPRAASGQTIPTYQIYGYGDLPFPAGDIRDDTQNSLDDWARYHVGTSGLHLSDVDSVRGDRGGWHDRFRTWTWRDRGTGIAVLKLTTNLYRCCGTSQAPCPRHRHRHRHRHRRRRQRRAAFQ